MVPIRSLPDHDTTKILILIKLFLVAVCIYSLVIISIDLSETGHFAYCQSKTKSEANFFSNKIFPLKNFFLGFVMDFLFCLGFWIFELCLGFWTLSGICLGFFIFGLFLGFLILSRICLGFLIFSTDVSCAITSHPFVHDCCWHCWCCWRCRAMKYISTLHSIITLGSSYIFRNNYNTYLQFHIVYCRDVVQHKVQATTVIVYSTSQLHMMLLV